MTRAIEIRVAAKTVADEYRCIAIEPDGSIWCDCGGFDGTICSHIDAALVAGERFMVHPDDHPVADLAMSKVVIDLPEHWKGSWRRNLRWRGLSTRTAVQRRPVGQSGRPVVCFTGGMPRLRAEYFAEAEAAGWETIDSPHRNITVLVAADPMGTSRKLVAARINGIPIVSLEDWPIVMIDGSFPEG